VPNSIIQKLGMSDARQQIGNLAQTNYYFAELTGIKDNIKTHFQSNYGSDFTDITRFVNRLGYLCCEASLPTSSYATAEVKDNFMGVTQEFAHTRIYTDLDLTFYVDAEYRVLRFFEGWMDYVGGGSEVGASSSPSGNVYRRFNYPKDYKLDTLKLYKFERDYRYSLNFTFINAFPKSVSSVPVSYGSAEILKVTVTFNYDRYLVTKTPFGSLDDQISNITNFRPQSQSDVDRLIVEPVKGAPTAKTFLGTPLNSQQTLNELYTAGRSGQIKSAGDFIGPLQ
jgi:hypothetical protein